MSREEQALLWRAVEQIPEIYREPLILFYRQHQSVETVARNLELTEDTAKQRLSRGRKILQEQVLAFVEGALQQTNPGKAFTMGVMTALPAMTVSTKAALLGTMAAKGSATAKTAGMTGALSGLLAPVLGFFGMWIGYRASVDSSQIDRERNFIKRFYKNLTLSIVVFAVLYVSLIFWGFFACQDECSPLCLFNGRVGGGLSDRHRHSVHPLLPGSPAITGEFDAGRESHPTVAGRLGISQPDGIVRMAVGAYSHRGSPG